ncbi:hypothetical protein BT69DRAFT_393820 [Atractiella rhizophila]|nr:hypothetical protein BT69DRAFT_393820 [Atractiella rhizophila]
MRTIWSPAEERPETGHGCTGERVDRHRTKEVLTCFVTTPQGGLVHYSETPKYPKAKGLTGRLKVPKEILSDGKEVVMNTGLSSLGVWICTGEVPAQFTENFDWQTIFPDFVRGVLQSDILDLTMRCSTINSSSPSETGEYAAILSSPKSWQSVREAITGRWFYPLSLDNLLPEEASTFDLRPRKVFLSSSASVHSSARLGPSAIISSSANIGSSATISRSSISPNVTIGMRASIDNSFVMAGAVIGEGAVVKDSVVSEGVVIEGGARVLNCILGDEVEVHEGAEVEDLWIGWDDDEGEGVDGVKGWIWSKPHDVDEEDEEDEEDEDWDKRMEIFYNLGSRRADYAASTASSSSSISGRSRSSSSASESLSSGPSSEFEAPAIANIESLSGNAAVEQKNQKFIVHCLESLRRAYDENLQPETTIIELKTLRLSSNVENSLVLRTVIGFLVERIEPAATPKETADRARNVIAKWNPLVSAWLEEPTKSGIDILLAMQQFCASHESHRPIFARLIATFWEEEVITKEAVVGWFTDERTKDGAGEGESGKSLREDAARVVKMIWEADDSDEEDAESSEEDATDSAAKVAPSEHDSDSSEESDEEDEESEEAAGKPLLPAHSPQAANEANEPGERAAGKEVLSEQSLKVANDSDEEDEEEDEDESETDVTVSRHAPAPDSAVPEALKAEEGERKGSLLKVASTQAGTEEKRR